MKSQALKRKRIPTKKLVYTALTVALTVVLSQISIPMPTGMPLTLQTFAIAFCGFLLGWKYGLASIAVYIVLGAAGLPVFANFTGGVGKLVGLTGGFIWGFLPMAFLCGIAKGRSAGAAVALAAAGLAICHALGVTQYSLVTEVEWGRSFLMVSLPYLLKDALSAGFAFFAARIIAARLRPEPTDIACREAEPNEE